MIFRYASALIFAALIAFPVCAEDSFPVHIAVDAAATQGKAEPVWRFFGADEPNYATMKDGRDLLTSLGALAPGHVYFRAHNLLSTGDGTPAFKWGSTNAYSEDAHGKPVYDWTIGDHIFDTYLARGVKPYVEIGFMPKALSTHPEPYQHAWRPGLDYHHIKTGWAYPPKDYAKWEELVYQWVSHCVARYGRAEVATWYWETWNEANLDFYWGGTRDEFYRLHDTTMRAVRRALPEARIGGPDVAGTNDDSLDAFLAHEAAAEQPLDFVSFHAKGAPTFVDGHVRMGISTQLQVADHDFASIAASPAYRDRPVIIGESDPEGCAACQGPANAYRNGTMYSSYTAASFPRLQALADRRGVHLQGALTWAFEFEDQRYFAGFRQLTSNGIDLPVLNVFRLFAMMGGERIQAVSDHQAALDAVLGDGVRASPDVGVTATRDGDTLAVLVWHYHDDDVAGPSAKVTLDLAHLPQAFAKGARIVQYRVDGDHANSFAAYQAMGSPLAPSDAQYAALKTAGTLSGDKAEMMVTKAAGTVSFDLPRQGVTLLVITPAG